MGNNSYLCVVTIETTTKEIARCDAEIEKFEGR